MVPHVKTPFQALMLLLHLLRVLLLRLTICGGSSRMQDQLLAAFVITATVVAAAVTPAGAAGST